MKMNEGKDIHSSYLTLMNSVLLILHPYSFMFSVISVLNNQTMLLM